MIPRFLQPAHPESVEGVYFRAASGLKKGQGFDKLSLGGIWGSYSLNGTGPN